MTQSTLDAETLRPQPTVPPADLTARSPLARLVLVMAELALLIVLSLYILAGAETVPFHGDESTILYTTRDVSSLVQGRIQNVLYSETPDAISPSARAEQELRLLNGSVARYVYGVAALNPRTLRPYDPINEQWDWSNGYAYNVETGHMPAPRALLQARLISSLFLIGAMLCVYVLARRIAGPGAAVIAVLYFTLNPAVLINGRRAFQESFWLFFGLFGLNIALDLAARIRGLFRSERYSRGHFLGRYQSVPLGQYIYLGGTLGVALVSKHTALFFIAAALGAVILAPLWAKRPIWLKHVIGVPLMLAALVAVFIVLSPAWWGDPIKATPILGRFDPIGRLETMLKLRSDLLAGQVAAFDGYDNTDERLDGLFRQGFIVLPQYYEVSGWQEYIGGQIAAYESSPWHGLSIGGDAFTGLVVLILVGLGLVACIRAVVVDLGAPARTDEVLVDALRVIWSPMGAWVALCLGAAGLAAALSTPLNWQRYYLPLYPAIAIFLGVGVMQCLRGLLRWRAQSGSVYLPQSEPFTFHK